MRKELRIAGYGGQGVVLAGVITGAAAVIHQHLHAVQTQTYGAASRGGAARSDIILSDSLILYPQVVSPDVLAAFSQDAWDKYGKNIKPDGIIIIDPDLVKIPDDIIQTVYSIKATEIATGEFKKAIFANMIMLGFITAAMGAITPGAIEKAIADHVPKGTEITNTAAFRRGFESFGMNSSV